MPNAAAIRIEAVTGALAGVLVVLLVGAQVQLPAAALTGLPTINDRDDPNQKAVAHDGKC
jgi:hypothetical protein